MSACLQIHGTRGQTLFYIVPLSLAIIAHVAHLACIACEPQVAQDYNAMHEMLPQTLVAVILLLCCYIKRLAHPVDMVTNGCAFLFLIV